MSSVRAAVAARLNLRLVMAVTIVAALTLAAGACSRNSNSNGNAAAAIAAIDGSGWHEIDDAIQGGTVPPTAESVATHLQIALLVTDWPSQLKAPATKLASLFGTMAGTINTDKPDMTKAKAASSQAHDAWHQFSTLVWNYLGDKAGVKNTEAPSN